MTHWRYSEAEADYVEKFLEAVLQRARLQDHDRISSYCPNELRYDYKGRTA